jgi:cytoskeletal protein CcmA (bactofilin family)
MRKGDKCISPRRACKNFFNFFLMLKMRRFLSRKNRDLTAPGEVKIQTNSLTPVSPGINCDASKNKTMNNMSTTSTSKNILNSDVEIKGNIKFSGELTLDGKLDGEIHTDGVLNLGDSAVVNGNVHAQSVVVRGKVNGNVQAKDKIDIKAKAELFGDIRAAKLAIEEGVIFVGKTEVNPNKISPTPQPARPGESPKTAAPEPAKGLGR